MRGKRKVQVQQRAVASADIAEEEEKNALDANGRRAPSKRTETRLARDRGRQNLSYDVRSEKVDWRVRQRKGR